uniref:ATP synthase subunit d, mitochondrial n=1 Tax=Wollemia nobilis TaxID=56998 RepID=A0A0C9S4K2_9CONI
MSGSGKKLAETAVKTIDWEGMAKMLVSDTARKEFFTLRRTYEDVKHTLDTKFSQEPQPIDWEYYRKGIGSRLVDMYKQAYESIEIPKYVDKITPEYKLKFEELLKQAKEAEQKSLQETERLDKEIAKIRELKEKITTMTADEYFAEYPEIKAKFDEEIRNDNWGY